LPPGRTREDCEAARWHERDMAWGAFVEAGVAPAELKPAPDNAGPVVDGALRFVARTPAKLAVLPLEDVLGLQAQPNLPGTTTEHPNWRRRYPDTADVMLDRPDVAGRLAFIGSDRN
jgi:4-alpha-glucanotransferase